MNRAIINIENLKCGGCANSIINSISKIKNVGNVEVNLDNNSVIIDHEDSVTRESLVAALTRLGYPEPGESTMILKAKSYVSCAIGRLSNEKK
jgi:copper chaperone CopZ